MKIKKKILFPSLAAAIILIALALDFFIYPTSLQCKSPFFNTGNNGLWLRYLWYFGEHTNSDAKKMCKHLHDDQIRYAYFHVRDLKSDGSLRFRYAEKAQNLVKLVRTNAPATKIIAWIYASSDTENGGVDLSDKAVRAKMVEEAQWLVSECGFDGVQWDYEFAPNSDSDLELLLEETKQALGKDHIVSCAIPMWYPGTLWGWSDAHVRQVASRCDQIAVMCYDSFFYLPRAYAWLLGQQCAHMLNDANASGGSCRVIFGVPSYDKGTAGHLNQAENLRVALSAMRNGLANCKTGKNRFDGVAIFAEYTTDDNEWKDYRQLWLNQP